MTNSDKNTNQEEPEVKKPKLWGSLYVILGIGGLTYAAYLLINCRDIVPLAGAMIAGVLIGVLSIFMIALGYRVIKRDY